jgi:hypothetical protein
MSTRTTNTIVHFSQPFELPDIDGINPAGDYKIVQDEELIEGLSQLAYQRVATFIHLPSISADNRRRQFVKIDPTLLEHLLSAAPSHGESAP